jgi:transposase
MLKTVISESDKQLLKEARNSYPHPRVLRKLDALYLKSFGLSNALICEVLDVCDNTLRDYFKQYLEGGVETLKEIKFHKPDSDLRKYAESIVRNFMDTPPCSIADASSAIATVTGIKRGETQTGKFLKSLGFRCVRKETISESRLSDSKNCDRRNVWKLPQTSDWKHQKLLIKRNI